jgi:hypothetical protein
MSSLGTVVSIGCNAHAILVGVMVLKNASSLWEFDGESDAVVLADLSANETYTARVVERLVASFPNWGPNVALVAPAGQVVVVTLTALACMRRGHSFSLIDASLPIQAMTEALVATGASHFVTTSESLYRSRMLQDHGDAFLVHLGDQWRIVSSSEQHESSVPATSTDADHQPRVGFFCRVTPQGPDAMVWYRLPRLVEVARAFAVDCRLTKFDRCMLATSPFSADTFTLGILAPLAVQSTIILNLTSAGDLIDGSLGAHHPTCVMCDLATMFAIRNASRQLDDSKKSLVRSVPRGFYCVGPLPIQVARAVQAVVKCTISSVISSPGGLVECRGDFLPGPPSSLPLVPVSPYNVTDDASRPGETQQNADARIVLSLTEHGSVQLSRVQEAANFALVPVSCESCVVSPHPTETDGVDELVVFYAPRPGVALNADELLRELTRGTRSLLCRYEVPTRAILVTTDDLQQLRRVLCDRAELRLTAADIARSATVRNVASSIRPTRRSERVDGFEHTRVEQLDTESSSEADDEVRFGRVPCFKPSVAGCSAVLLLFATCVHSVDSNFSRAIHLEALVALWVVASQCFVTAAQLTAPLEGARRTTFLVHRMAALHSIWLYVAMWAVPSYIFRCHVAVDRCPQQIVNGRFGFVWAVVLQAAGVITGVHTGPTVIPAYGFGPLCLHGFVTTCSALLPSISQLSPGSAVALGRLRVRTLASVAMGCALAVVLPWCTASVGDWASNSAVEFIPVAVAAACTAGVACRARASDLRGCVWSAVVSDSVSVLAAAVTIAAMAYDAADATDSKLRGDGGQGLWAERYGMGLLLAVLSALHLGRGYFAQLMGFRVRHLPVLAYMAYLLHAPMAVVVGVAAPEFVIKADAGGLSMTAGGTLVVLACTMIMGLLFVSFLSWPFYCVSRALWETVLCARQPPPSAQMTARSVGRVIRNVTGTRVRAGQCISPLMEADFLVAATLKNAIRWQWPSNARFGNIVARDATPSTIAEVAGEHS